MAWPQGKANLLVRVPFPLHGTPTSWICECPKNCAHRGSNFRFRTSWLISEHHEPGWVIRRYEVETPQWYVEWPLDVRLSKLVELELRVSEPCAGYFRRVPYSLVECIWCDGLNTACGTAFCCCDYDVLYYPRMPVVRPVPKLRNAHTGPIELTVKLGPAPGEPWGLVR